MYKRQGLKGSLPKLVSPNTARDFVYVDDACEAFVLAARRQAREAGSVFNVGSGTQTTVREAVGVAIERLAIKAQPQFDSMEARSWDTASWVADPRRILAELGWEPTVDFATGFGRLVEWLRAESSLSVRYGLASS